LAICSIIGLVALRRMAINFVGLVPPRVPGIRVRMRPGVFRPMQFAPLQPVRPLQLSRRE